GYDQSVDWWCLGAVLYEMLYGLPPFYSRNTAEMYDRILNKPLRLRPTISESAMDILTKLLQKDRHKRLGSGYRGFDEVKRHDFYKLINWEDLIAKRIPPPFNPNVQSPMDLRHIDPEFTREVVASSVGQSQSTCMLSASVCEADDAFAGFSYARPIDLHLDKYYDTMSAEQQQFFLKWNDFQSNMVSSFKHLRDEKSFTDVTLACEGQTCKAHKMVLSACSPYFKSLLEILTAIP
ncbi:hypothetical protein L9F63_014404, partial [Diploptera punctata]